MKLQIKKDNKLHKVFISILTLAILFIPITSFAGGLVPCDTDCGFNDFILIIKNIINFISLIAFSVAVIMFSYAGFLYLTAGGEQGKLKSAHNIFTTSLYGLFFIFGAWLIVNTVASVLLNDSFLNGSFKFFFNT